MIDAKKYLGRAYHWRDYNCWDFVREVWLDYTGVDLGKRTPDESSLKAFRDAFDKNIPEVENVLVHRIPRPADPCIVYMERPKVASHVGIMTGGRVLHLVPNRESVLEDFEVASFGFKIVRFYR